MTTPLRKAYDADDEFAMLLRFHFGAEAAQMRYRPKEWPPVVAQAWARVERLMDEARTWLKNGAPGLPVGAQEQKP